MHERMSASFCFVEPFNDTENDTNTKYMTGTQTAQILEVPGQSIVNIT
jgi:hypothetical protein